MEPNLNDSFHSRQCSRICSVCSGNFGWGEFLTQLGAIIFLSWNYFNISFNMMQKSKSHWKHRLLFLSIHPKFIQPPCVQVSYQFWNEFRSLFFKYGVSSVKKDLSASVSLCSQWKVVFFGVRIALPSNSKNLLEIVESVLLRLMLLSLVADRNLFFSDQFAI